jgi:hypothetical protein
MLPGDTSLLMRLIARVDSVLAAGNLLYFLCGAVSIYPLTMNWLN